MPRSNFLLFVFLTVIQILLRVIYIDYNGFWHDEAFSLFYSQQHWGHIKHISEWDINPPLYFYLLWIWQHLFGISEFAIRFLSLFFGALSGTVLFFFARKFFSLQAAIFVFILFLFSYPVFYYAHEARPYTIILFFTLSSSYFFFSLNQQISWRNAIILGVLNFGIVYLNYISGIVLLFQLIVAVVYFNQSFRKFFAISMGITFLLVFLRYTKKMILLILNNKKSTSWIQKPQLVDLLKLFNDLLNHKWLALFLLFILIFVLVFLTMKSQLKKNIIQKKELLFYCFSVGVVSIYFCFALSQFVPMFVNRYLLFTLPFILLIISYLVTLIKGWLNYVLQIIVSLAFIVSFCCCDLKTSKPMNYRDAVAFIKTKREKETPIFIETPDLAALFAYYYKKEIFTHFEDLRGRLKEDQLFLLNEMKDFEVIDVPKQQKIILSQSYEQLNSNTKQLED